MNTVHDLDCFRESPLVRENEGFQVGQTGSDERIAGSSPRPKEGLPQSVLGCGKVVGYAVSVRQLAEGARPEVGYRTEAVAPRVEPVDTVQSQLSEPDHRVGVVVAKGMAPLEEE